MSAHIFKRVPIVSELREEGDSWIVDRVRRLKDRWKGKDKEELGATAPATVARR
jgi:hypothetical protein